MKRATRIYKKLLFLRKISIHALVKRATSRAIKTLMFHVISIHALVKRATATFDFP